VLSGRGLCDELITRPEESYRLCCVVVCDLETSRIGAPYIYICDISSLRVNGPSEPGRLRDVCVCQWVNFAPRIHFILLHYSWWSPLHSTIFTALHCHTTLRFLAFTLLHLTTLTDGFSSLGCPLMPFSIYSCCACVDYFPGTVM